MTEKKRKWGFALLTPEQRKEIASKGGRAAQKRGRAHQFGSDDAREAGRKGGRVRPGDRQAREEEE